MRKERVVDLAVVGRVKLSLRTSEGNGIFH